MLPVLNRWWIEDNVCTTASLLVTLISEPGLSFNVILRNSKFEMVILLVIAPVVAPAAAPSIVTSPSVPTSRAEAPSATSALLLGSTRIGLARPRRRTERDRRPEAVRARVLSEYVVQDGDVLQLNGLDRRGQGNRRGALQHRGLGLVGLGGDGFEQLAECPRIWCHQVVLLGSVLLLFGVLEYLNVGIWRLEGR